MDQLRRPVVAGLGAVATEFSGIAGIGDLFGVSRWFSLAMPAVLLMTLVATRSYRRVARYSVPARE